MRRIKAIPSNIKNWWNQKEFFDKLLILIFALGEFDGILAGVKWIQTNNQFYYHSMWLMLIVFLCFVIIAMFSIIVTDAYRSLKPKPKKVTLKYLD